MKVPKFLNEREITIEEVKESLEFVGTKNIDMNSTKGCGYCGDELNSHSYPSESWTAVRYCYRCNVLSLIYVQDRMAGIYYDVYNFYK